MTSDPQKPSSRTTFKLRRLLHIRPRRRTAKPPKKPLPPPARPERWLVFELGRFAHHLRDDDLFPAERTFCGKRAVDLDMHPLPQFNSFPADYLQCRVCCYLQSRHLRKSS